MIKRASAPRCRLLLLTLSFLVTVAVVSSQLRYGIRRHWTPQIISASLPREVIQEEVSDLEIREVIALPEDEFLLVITTRDHPDSRQISSCSIAIGSETLPARIVGNAAIGENRGGIRCRTESQFSSKVNGSTGVRAQLRSTQGRIIGSSSRIPLLHWNRMVLEALVTEEDVVLFTKGILPVRKEEQERAMIKRTRCAYFNEDNSQIVVETELLSLSQEIVRCRHPPPALRDQLLGNKVTIKTPDHQLAPSAVFYSRPTIRGSPRSSENPPAADASTRHSVCACTMVFNVAKFLPEWVRYHSHLGINKFFLYDNNSEDPIHETIHRLNSDESSDVKVTTRSWPWSKTQESGFSHCALTAREQHCDWMAFIDVDEFIFPKSWVGSRFEYEFDSEPKDQLPIISRLINSAATQQSSSINSTTTAEKTMGQISLHCRDFGPSGQKSNPVNGVTQGYTCRVVRENRHKSLVKLEAISESLENVIHHFKLRSSYKTVRIPARRGVVNHYKYQAWDEFKHKFRRRVSAYVTDWRESKNINSQDRTPGLTNEAVKPPNWESQFCEVEDTELKEYVHSALRLQI